MFNILLFRRNFRVSQHHNYLKPLSLNVDIHTISDRSFVKILFLKVVLPIENNLRKFDGKSRCLVNQR